MSQPFSRVVERSKTQSWKTAVPVVVAVIALLALLGYLASKLSSYEQRAATAEQENKTMRDQQQGMTQQIGGLQRDLGIAKSPGRTTVILSNADKKAKDGAWAAVTWGEQEGAKSWMRVAAYGLQPDLEGKAYHVWFTPISGAPVDLGALAVDQNGGGFAMSITLPALDQGKSVILTLDDANAKQPGQTIAQADLPKLRPTLQGAPENAPANAEQPQAKPGPGSQPMHKPGK